MCGDQARVQLRKEKVTDEDEIERRLFGLAQI